MVEEKKEEEKDELQKNEEKKQKEFKNKFRQTLKAILIIEIVLLIVYVANNAYRMDEGYGPMAPGVLSALIWSVVLTLLVFFVSAFFITVQEGFIVVVKRLGKVVAVRNPGLSLILPFIHTFELVDMRIQITDIPPEEIITSDDVVVFVDALVYFRVDEENNGPFKFLFKVKNAKKFLTKLTIPHIRELGGEMTLKELRSSRDEVNDQIKSKLDEETDPWGIKVEMVEIQKIDPPPSVIEAMNRQVEADRMAKAKVIEAEGEKKARILMAEGTKQAEILEAEGKKNAIENITEALEKSKEGAESYVAMELAKAIKAGDKIVIGKFGDLLSSFFNRK